MRPSWSSAALAGLWHLGDVALLVIGALASIGWVVLCDRAERTGRHEMAPLAVSGVAVGLLIVVSGWGSDAAGLVQRWSTWVGFGSMDSDRLLMVVGVVLLQLVTGISASTSKWGK